MISSFRLYPADGDMFTTHAAADLVGRTVPVQGVPREVTDASLEPDGAILLTFAEAS